MSSNAKTEHQAIGDVCPPCLGRSHGNAYVWVARVIDYVPVAGVAIVLLLAHAVGVATGKEARPLLVVASAAILVPWRDKAGQVAQVTAAYLASLPVQWLTGEYFIVPVEGFQVYVPKGIAGIIVILATALPAGLRALANRGEEGLSGRFAASSATAMVVMASLLLVVSKLLRSVGQMHSGLVISHAGPLLLFTLAFTVLALSLHRRSIQCVGALGCLYYWMG